MFNTQIYFHESDQSVIEAILGVEARPYQEEVMMAEITNLGSLTKLKQERYTGDHRSRPFAFAYYWIHEVGARSEERTYQFNPKMNFDHPVKGMVRFTTVTESELLTLDKKTSVEKGRADDRIVIDEDRPLPSAFERYQGRCDSDYKMVVIKAPHTLVREFCILIYQLQKASTGEN